MDTPIADFVRAYAADRTARLHMPGHKGRGPLGCEEWDITEISGADALYEAQGIIARSEANAGVLFGSGRTFYSTEGSSQCIRAMLYLALQHRPAGTPPVIVAARNVHKAYVYAAALLDFETVWLWPEENSPLCGCPVSPETLERTLSTLDTPPAAVYLTSPDYLGGMADITAMAAVCRRHSTLLLVDNAHGAYLRWLGRHPLDLGADLCCDSAHKTLPVLTGGAYLHLSARTPAALRQDGKAALALFGSTSPSYLTLASLDLCNRRLAEGYEEELRGCLERLEGLRRRLRDQGWKVAETDPLRVTLAAPENLSGLEMARRLRQGGVECEYADPEFVVLMATPDNTVLELERVAACLGENRAGANRRPPLPPARGERVCSVRQAIFAHHRTVAASESLGLVCGAPTVACPPAIPIAVSGERIGPEALALFAHYGVETVDVLE